MKKNKKKKKISLSSVILLIIFLVGLSVMVYPTFSNWWNSMHMSRAVASYQEAVEDTSKAEREAMLAAAEDYNRRLFERNAGIGTNLDDYDSVLDITGTGIMGYITIQKLDLELPIYHGMDANVLQVGVGHVTGSSLPVGGKNTFTVLSGHRGMPDARLFTDIDQLVKGDVFIITVLDRKIAYQVDDISTVLPREVEELNIVPGKDYCTLVTCTPYGINTHRLLVRGHRVALPDNTELPTTQEKIQAMSKRIKLLILLLALLLLLGILWLWHRHKKKKKKQNALRERRESVEKHPENWNVIEEITVQPADRARSGNKRSRKRTRTDHKNRKPHD